MSVEQIVCRYPVATGRLLDKGLILRHLEGVWDEHRLSVFHNSRFLHFHAFIWLVTVNFFYCFMNSVFIVLQTFLPIGRSFIKLNNINFII